MRLGSPTRRLAVPALATALAVALAACGGGSQDKSASSDPHDGAALASAQADGGTPAYTPSGPILSDSGFRPEVNGFGFQNYSAGYQDMTSKELVDLFGPKVCQGATATPTCVLTPPAEAWMNATNKQMDGGHCFGFSLAALLMYEKVLNPLDFGGAAVPALPIFGNSALQQRIAEEWAVQILPRANASVITGTPNHLLDVLRARMANRKETYTVSIWKRDLSVGHAITAYGIEDKGDGTSRLLIYDNNFPGITRAITFDHSKDSWSYVASANPDVPAGLYEGDAQSNTMLLTPTSVGVGAQPCPFCDQRTPGARPYDDVFLASDPVDHGHLVITDAAGHRTGFVDGKFVNEIPGARILPTLQDASWTLKPEPHYQIPTGTKVTIALDGSKLDKPDAEAIAVVGPGHSTTAGNVILRPGQTDTMELSANRLQVLYRTANGYSQSPNIQIGLQRAGLGYKFAVAAPKLAGGSTLSATAKPALGRLLVDAAGVKSAGAYSLVVTTLSSTGRQSVQGKRTQVAAGGSAQLHFVK